MHIPLFYIYLRHYIHDKATYLRYKEIVQQSLSLAKHKNIRLSLVVGLSTKLFSSSRKNINNFSHMLLNNQIEVNYIHAKGAGHALFFSLFQAINNQDELICVLDADQFLFDSPLFYQRLMRLGKKMIRKKALTGVGIRNKIFLGRGKLGELREIDERYQALFTQKRLKYKKAPLTIPLSYQELGDPLTGCTCFNVSHPKFVQLITQLLDGINKANLYGYAGDPYIIMRAAKLGNILTEIVPTRDNPPGSFTINEIKKKNIELGKTSLRQSYLPYVQSKKNMELLSQYYPKKSVQFVRRMILQALHSKIK